MVHGCRGGPEDPGVRYSGSFCGKAGRPKGHGGGGVQRLNQAMETDTAVFLEDHGIRYSGRLVSQKRPGCQAQWFFCTKK